MSNNIPFDIQAEIIIRLPIKSLMRFRSVSKSWESLIHTPKFISNHTSSHTQSQHLLIRYKGISDNFCKPHYVSIVDDNTLPHRNTFLNVPISVEPLIILGGSSHGLFCLYKDHGKLKDDSETTRAIIWNPTLRKFVDVVVPNVRQYKTVIGFGVCPHTSDPKLVKIRYFDDRSPFDTISTTPWQVEVFSLSSRAWKSVSISLPRKSIRFGWNQADIEGIIYWLATDFIKVNGHVKYKFLIMSFDMASEEFTDVYLPDKLARGLLSISKLRESLVVLKYNTIAEKPVYDVWIMNNDDPKSFTNLFSIKTQDAWLQNVHGFRKSGEPIIEIMTKDRDDGPSSLFVYKSYSEHIDIGISGYFKSDFFVCSYTETLLLLDQ